MIDYIKQTSTVSIVQKAFAFFDKNDISLETIVKCIQSNFKPENCLSANNDNEAERNQILLNTLEDENNPIRAIFAVQKLNEGWDVLNLFDIVRLYEDRDGKNGKPGKTTISEAQLIGRGARYYPFSIHERQDKYIRKYDNDPASDLKILEELYYHTREDSRYISELKRALIETGIYEDESDYIVKKLTLKQIFKDSDFYKNGRVFFNKKEIKKYKDLHTLLDLGLGKVNYQHILSSGIGKTTTIFSDSEPLQNNEVILKGKDIKLIEIPQHIIRYALILNPFFLF
ncbi:hypothetical protein [Gracilinema caldarium]|uniref:hypothetical protein n=1 Tax=Gracilinema caldarium TaxID=215591 RepID=UPI0002E2990C|nr:hypothetical protein [Gracilinema caldarium]